MSDDPVVADHDVLLVGGGGAGLRAAIAIAETEPGLDVAVVSKVYPMRSHTVSAEGGAAGVIAEGDTIDEHIYDTISGSDWLGDQDAIEAFVQRGAARAPAARALGLPVEPAAGRPGGGARLRWHEEDAHLVRRRQDRLPHAALAVPDLPEVLPVARYDEWFVTRLLVDEGRVHGVVAVELSTGRIRAITARAVVLATGGCGKVFPFTTNANINTGDGMALAYRAGAPLKDMEFVQYHPTGLPFTGILITEATRAEGGWLLNKDGYRYLQDYDLGTPTPEPTLRSMELGPRDRLSQAFVHEAEKGRTLDSEWGPIVHLDLRHLGEKLIDTKLPFVRELCLKYERIDPVTELIPVRPVVHYMMGGVHTDIDGATPLAGLYAAGETACVSINGANRLGSNSLPECLVFGARAGPGGRDVRRERRSSPGRRHRAGERRGTPPGAAPRTRRPGTTPSPRSGPRCRRRWRTPPGSTGPGPTWPRVSTGSRSCRNACAGSGSGTPVAASTPSWSPRWSSPTCSTSPSACSPRACAARSRAVRTSAPTSPPVTTRGSSPTRWSSAIRTAHRASPSCR